MESHGSRYSRWVWTVAALAAIPSMSACATSKIHQPHRAGLFDQPEMQYQARTSPRAKSALPIPPRSEKPDPEDMDDRVPASAVRKIRASVQSWKWPVANPFITSRFGVRHGDMHEGIDLRAAKGSPVYATDDGVVLYSDKRLRGYGNMIVVKHGKDLSTIYAHNSKNLVKAGQKIRQGQKIALAGSTGHSSGPHLHFELRQGVNPVDPLAVLPHPHRGTLVRMETPAITQPSTKVRPQDKIGARRIAQARVATQASTAKKGSVHSNAKHKPKPVTRAGKKSRSPGVVAARDRDLSDSEFEKTRRQLSRNRPSSRVRQ